MGALAGLFRTRGLGSASDWSSLAVDAGTRYGVDPALILAVIQAESGGDPNPPHRAGDGWGLMQVTEATAAWLAGHPVAPDDLVDPVTNVDLGTRYLAYQLDRYGGDVASAVNAYRAGTASDTPLSQSYVARVLAFFQGLADTVVSSVSGSTAEAGTPTGPATPPFPATTAGLWAWARANPFKALGLGLLGLWVLRGRR